MSIKPVDFQVMLPKTAEVSKISHDEQHKNQAVQQLQASMSQLKSDSNLRQVHFQDRTQEAGIREKQEKNQGSKKEKKNKQGNNSDKNLNASTIDIRL